MQGLPVLPNTDGLRKQMQVEFGGYDHNLGADEGSIWDMENLCEIGRASCRERV